MTFHSLLIKFILKGLKMMYGNRVVLAIGEEYVIYALPHQTRLIEKVLEDKDGQKSLKERVYKEQKIKEEKDENGNKD